MRTAASTGSRPDRKLTLVAQTNEAEATRLLRWNGALLAATGNMGKIYRLGDAARRAPMNRLCSMPASIAQWGKLRWQGDKAGGDRILRTRSGNSMRPDKTWSDWSEPVRVNAGAQITSPNARYLQFNVELSGAGVAIDNISAAYLPQNQPPVVRSDHGRDAAVPSRNRPNRPQRARRPPRPRPTASL